MGLFDNLPPAQDGDASVLGRLGLQNELACWLVARGHGDFLGMLPSELSAYAKAPAPRCREHDWRPLMQLRGLDWVCFDCTPPRRARRRPKPLYAEGRIEDHLDEIVGVQLTPLGWVTTREKF